MPDLDTTLDRRDLMKGAAVSLGGLSLGAILADPRLARAAAAETQSVALTTAAGRTVSAALALPEKTPAPAVLLIHEWWGLNDQIKSVARDLAKAGYVALAIDLYDGHVASEASGARYYMGLVDDDEALDTLTSWAAWLKAHEAVTGGATGAGVIGTVGWCLGGGWSLKTSLATPVDATVIYYGRVGHDEDTLRQLKGPVLGHFGEKDKHIDHDMVDPFDAALTAIGHPHQIYWYDANHAFANPTGNSYQAGDAKLAWDRTLAFFAEHLGPA
jgi:carboxymethylenebutenolidase